MKPKFLSCPIGINPAGFWIRLFTPAVVSNFIVGNRVDNIAVKVNYVMRAGIMFIPWASPLEISPGYFCPLVWYTDIVKDYPFANRKPPTRTAILINRQKFFDYVHVFSS